MQGGFNTNIKYQGRTFHVQTEDSGHANPKIITLLYEGGTILTSKKSSYEDLVSAENLESVVKDLMERQHREMVKALKEGQLDEVISGAKPIGRRADGSLGDSTGGLGFGEGVISDVPLDELVLAHLCAS